MAIIKTQGTLNPTSGTQANDLRVSWVASFAGKTGWTVVDDGYVNGTSIRSVLVNSAGFAIMIWNGTVGTNLAVCIAIGNTYNATTHTLTNTGVGTIFGSTWSGTWTVDANGLSGININPTAAAGTVTGLNVLQINATASQTAWSTHIESTYAILSLKDGNTTTGGVGVYLGAYTSLVTNPLYPDTMPYVLASTFQQSRFLTSLGNYGVSYSLYQGGVCFTSRITNDPTNNIYKDKYQNNATNGTVAEAYVARQNYEPISTNINSADPAVAGWLRGKLKSIVSTISRNAVWGDTVVVGTKTYMYIGGRGNYSNGDFGNGIAWWAEI